MISDSSVIKCRADFESRSLLDKLIREAVRRMLQTALQTEVDDFLVVLQAGMSFGVVGLFAVVALKRGILIETNRMAWL